MKIGQYLLATLAVGFLSLTGSEAFAGTWYPSATGNYTLGNQNYSGSVARKYRFYKPSGAGSNAPMVMVLHGCKQTYDNVKNDWNFKELADSKNFILVTPFITSYDGMRNENCWGFWFDQHTHEGMGEPEDLYQIAQEVIAHASTSINTDKVYITGLSSGGAMTVVAAVTHNEFWTAAAPIAGLPYGETSSAVNLSGCSYVGGTFKSVSAIKNSMDAEMDDTYKIPVLVLGNKTDCVVPETNFNNIRDSFKQLWGSSGYTEASPSCGSYWTARSGFSGCARKTYTKGGKVLVATATYTGAEVSGMNKHYITGAKNDNAWAIKQALNMPLLAWDFFNSYSRSGQASANNGNPVVVVEGDNPERINEGQSYVERGVTVIDEEDENDTESSNAQIDVDTSCNVNTNVEGEYSCEYTATDSDNNSKTVERVVVVNDTGTSDNCTGTTATRSAHYSAGRLSKSGGVYYDDNSRFLGASPATDSLSIKLFQSGDGSWTADEPDSCKGGMPSAPPGGKYCGTAKVSEHLEAGRIYQGHNLSGLPYGACKTVGGNDALDAYSSTCANLISAWGDPNITIKETVEGTYDKTSCP